MTLPIAKLLTKRGARYRDVVGLDLGVSATKAVRLRRAGSQIEVVAADILPAHPVPAGAVAGGAGPALELPRTLRGRHIALAVTSRDASAKLLQLPGDADPASTGACADLLGLDGADRFRFAQRLLESESRSEHHVLAVALPEADIAWAKALVSHSGAALCSLEVSGLAALSAFVAGPGLEHRDGCVMAVDFGAACTAFGIFHRCRPVVVRLFPVGVNTVLRQIMEDLGVDEPTGLSILEDGTVNARSSVRKALEGFLRQATIAIDFAERRHNNRLQKVYASGGFVGSADWRAEMRGALGLAPEAWSPWQGLRVLPDAVPDRLARMEGRFAAAVGAAYAVLERT